MNKVVLSLGSVSPWNSTLRWGLPGVPLGVPWARGRNGRTSAVMGFLRMTWERCMGYREEHKGDNARDLAIDASGEHA